MVGNPTNLRQAPPTPMPTIWASQGPSPKATLSCQVSWIGRERGRWGH